MNIDVSVLSTVAALGADCAIVNKQITVTGLKSFIPVSTLKPSSVVAPVTGVVQITTYTPTVANSTSYALALGYLNKVTRSWTYSVLVVDSDSSATDTEICNAFRNQISLMTATMPIVGSGTTTLILTAEAGYEVFTSSSIGVGVLTPAATQAGVIRVGYGADLKVVYPEASSSITDTSYYYQVSMDYIPNSYGTQTMTQSNVVNRAAVLVLSTATNVLSLVGTYGTLTQAISGWQATWTAAGTVPTLSNGVITLGGADIFYGNSDTNVGLDANDVINIVKTTATAYNLNYRLASLLSGTTAATNDIPNDLAAAATDAWYIKLTKL